MMWTSLSAPQHRSAFIEALNARLTAAGIPYRVAPGRAGPAALVFICTVRGRGKAAARARAEAFRRSQEETALLCLEGFPEELAGWRHWLPRVGEVPRPG